MKSKTNFKKLLSIALACVMMVICNGSYSREASATTLEGIAFEKAVGEIMKDYNNDPELAVQKLALLDTVLLSEPKPMDNVFRTMPTDYDFSVYSFKRGNHDTHYLQWNIKPTDEETFEGPLDYVSIEWDTEYASYYSSDGDGSFSTVQARDDGIVLFNLEDGNFGDGESSIGTVRVLPIKTGWLEYGSKYVHTYTSFLVSGSASFQIKPSAELSSDDFSLGIEGSMGFTVNVSSNTEKWQLWTDNAVNVTV